MHCGFGYQWRAVDGRWGRSGIRRPKPLRLLYVPVRAVRAQGNQKRVTVLFKAQNIEVSVVTGLTNEQFAEIASATPELKEGDQVVIAKTTTRSGTGGAIPGMGGGAIPGMGGVR